MNSKIAAYVGFAQRSGKILYGSDRILERPEECIVILVDADAPDKFKERLKTKCEKVFELPELTGYLHRENVKAVAILDKDLGGAILDQLR